MTLDDLLQELRENILHDRSDQIAGTPDQLWSDTTLVRYIDEAQRRFARKSLCIRDGTTASCTQVTLLTGVNEYALHPSVIAVISAKRTSPSPADIADLARASHAQFDTYRQPDTYFFDPSSLSALPPGKPLAFGTDDWLSFSVNNTSGIVTFRIYPIPSADFNNNVVSLRVCRMPISRLTLVEKDVYPEIPEEYHLDMLDWAAYLALRIVDHDAGDPARAQEFRQSFEAAAEAARRESLRKMFAPLQWGFGRAGFSWEGNSG